MAHFKIHYKSDTLVEFLASIDESDGSAITVASGGSCVARLFDDNKDTRLSADEATSQTVLSVNATRGNRHAFEVGDKLYIELDDGTYDSIDIASIQHADGTITIDSGLASGAAKGAAISVLLGASVTMSEFGSPESPPEATSKLWGWRGTIADTHADLEIGQEIRVQIELNGGAGLQERSLLYAKLEGAS